MSTLKATNIKNESSASNNIVLDSGGGVVVSGILTATTFSGNVSGNITIGAGSTSAPSLAPSGDSNTGVFFPSADTIAFAEGGTESARFDSSGRFLVGTTSARSNIYMGGASDTPKFQFEGSGNDYSTHLSLIQYSSVGTAPSLTLGLSKTVTPGSNTIVASGDTLATVNFVGNDGTNFRTAAQIQALCDTTPGSGDMPGRLIFSTTADGASSPTERMRISNNGAVLLSGPSANAAAFTINSAVAGTAGGNYPLASINSTGTSDSGAACLHLGKSDNSTSTSNVFQRFYINSAGTGSGQINANGASAAAFGTFSDERLKENITELPSQLQNICALRPVEFDYKDGSGHQIGFIAQEMQTVYPDVVGETEGMFTVTGWSKTEARLVKALQEAIAKIETLEAQNAAILARLDAAGL